MRATNFVIFILTFYYFKPVQIKLDGKIKLLISRM